MSTHEVAAAFNGVRALPTSFLIDREGRVRHEIPGLLAEPALRIAVDRLLAEPPPAAAGGGAR
jgi:thioredoxin-related protein